MFLIYCFECRLSLIFAKIKKKAIEKSDKYQDPLNIYRFYNRHVFMAMNFSFNRFPSPPEKENSIAMAIKGHCHQNALVGPRFSQSNR